MAIKWFSDAADLGDMSAQFNLGVMYYKGQTILHDYAKALAWYERSAKQGYAKAQSNLGVMYIRGQGVRKDLPKAYIWFQLAAEQGLSAAKQNSNLVRSRMSTEQFTVAGQLLDELRETIAASSKDAGYVPQKQAE